MLCRLTYISFFCFGLILSVSAQNGVSFTQGAYANGLGQSGSALMGLQALSNNPAALSKNVNFGIQFSSEQRFLLTDINATSIGIVKAFENLGSFSLHLDNYGLEEFNQKRIGIGYSRRLSDRLNVGIKFNLWNTAIDGYGSNSKIGMEIGLLSKISRELSIGFHLINPINQSITETTDLNTTMKIGLAYQTQAKFIILADVTKGIEYKQQFHVGLLYQAMELMDFKIGMATSPSIISFGVGYKISNVLRFDGANRYHQNLGNTPSVSISYQNK